MAAVLDAFIPTADVRTRHATLVHAPAPIVFDVARHFNLQSVPLIRRIFALRAKILGAGPGSDQNSLAPDDLLRMGWATLAEEPGHVFIAGAACQPWQADVVFTPIGPERFRLYAEPNRVKVAWTLEAESQGSELTRFATETRALGTDALARSRFRRYWRRFGVGIVAIRWILLPAIRREAERRWRASAR
jgi:hypothetical protein